MFRQSVTTLFLSLLLLPLAAVAQGPKPEDGAQPTSKTVDELDKELQDLKREVASMRNGIAAVATAEDIATAIAGLEQRLSEQIATRMSGVDNRVRELTVKTEQLSNSDALRLDANMQDDEFRQTMQEAVNDSIRQTGVAVIRNKMTTQQQIQVNQREYVVDAGGSLTLDVPVGTLTAKLPGQPLTTWTITAPKYEQIIDIVPNSETVTAYRPTGSSSTVTVLRPLDNSTTVYSAPVYTTPVYTTPVYVETWPTYYYDPWTGAWYSY